MTYWNSTKNGQGIMLDVPAQAVEGRTMVPVGFIAQAFGENVEWDAATKTVLINSTPLNSPVIVTPVPPVVNPVTTPSITPPSVNNPDPIVITIDPTKNGTWMKGNKNSLIYHVPGGRDYDKVSPQNIVWFETREDAQAAGYREAMQ